jgi:hypothetical protein
MKAIYTAFVKAQQDFAPALKTSLNPHFKSKYVSLDACIEAVLDALNNNGIGLLQPTHECSDGVTVETLFIHTSGECMSGGKLHVPAAKNDPQGYGSALTYARRYSLMAACGIAPEDDDANAACRPVAKPVAKPNKHISELKLISSRAELIELYKSLPEHIQAELKQEFSLRSAELEAAA